jgi:hypothetical protein
MGFALLAGQGKPGEDKADKADTKIAPYYPTPNKIVEKMLELVKQSAARIRSLGLTPTAHIIEGDLLEQDYSSADLLTIYLLPVAIEKVTPILEKQLKKGTRVVVHDFEFFQWKAAKVMDIDDDGEGRSHRLFLYRR